MGVDIDVSGPRVVHPDLELTIFVDSALPMKAVRSNIHDALAGKGLNARRRAFLHPDRWSLGQSLFEGPMVACLAEVPGVRWVDVVRFQRLDATEYDIEPGIIAVAEDEVIRLPRGAASASGDGIKLTIVGVE